MKISVLSCSPKGENSLTLQTARFLKKYFPDDTFNIHMTFNTVCPDEVAEDCKDADLVMILSSIFHLNVHAQMMTMLDELVEKLGDKSKELNFTYVTTSNFLYDIGAHKYVKSWARSKGLKMLRILSLKDDSMLEEWSREELVRWFQYTKDTIELQRTGAIPQVTEPRRVAIINDGLSSSRTDVVKALYEARGCSVEVFNINEYTIKPCTACFACYSNRTCHIKDDFLALYDKIYTGTDLVINMGTLKVGMLSQQFKKLTDRQVQFGRAGSSDEMVHLALLETDEDLETRTISLMEYAQWEEATVGIGRDYVVGAYFSRIGSEDIDVTPYVNDSILVLNNELYGQRSIFSENLNTRFAELAHMLQTMCPLDYDHYKKDGYYKGMPFNSNVRYINDVKEGILSCKMRLTAYDMAFEQPAPTLTKRRKYKDMSFVEHRKLGDAPKGNKGGGFLGLFGKK